METYRRVYDCELVVGLQRERLCEELVSWSPPEDTYTINIGGPSWTWPYTNWWTSSRELSYQLTVIDTLLDVGTRIEHIADNVPASSKLTLSGLILKGVPLVDVLLHCRDLPSTPGLVSERSLHTYLDIDYGESFSCKCMIPKEFVHSSRDIAREDGHMNGCKTYNVVSAMTPRISALFIGTAFFQCDIRQWIRPKLNWHFLLIQIQDGVDETSGHPQFCRVGTMHIPEEQIIGNIATIMESLRAQERETIVLV